MVMNPKVESKKKQYIISPNWLISGSDSYVTAMLVYQRVFDSFCNRLRSSFLRGGLVVGGFF